MEKRYFTVEEANNLLPLLEQELLRLQKMKEEYHTLYQELLLFKKLHDHLKETKYYQDTVFTLECRLEFQEMEAQMLIKSLSQQGIQIKDIDIGLVDFPAILEGEEVLLCWKLGEERVTHYHGIHEGFAGRKQIDTE
ncbi:DUF2203 domain-containing protein [Brevibacillus humidisoli]|uniref:DUF2203 domain-containing protein n=1 Tax=Brevibacillus humidisoli TaxID=2895522 RepID=UPI001E34EF17|nr:DUF2203 domain-containing protein [Brevibacillus humidisoli]UFJ42381.1 DUF2203 domain-containing protein [Brevibacillus humidisoli]